MGAGGPRCNGPSQLNSTVHADLDTYEEESLLNQRERAELFSGRFPANFSGEAIHIRTSGQESHRLQNAFGSTRLE